MSQSFGAKMNAEIVAARKASPLVTPKDNKYNIY